MSTVLELEERITSLETRIAFQDKTIDELNDVVTAQQKQIDDLFKRLRELIEQIGPTPLDKNADTRPPHY